MLSLFNPYKWWIIGAGAIVISAASAWGSYGLTKKWYTNHYEAIITKKDKEFSKYKDDQRTMRDQADALVRNTQTKNSELILELTNQVRYLESKNVELANEVKNVTNRHIRAIAAGRGVFVDKGKTIAACPRDSSAATTTTTAKTEPVRPRELSRETTEFLLDFAESAELTRQDLNTQVEYSDKLAQTYEAMRQNYQKLSDYVKEIGGQKK